MTLELVVFTGLQAAGKTSFYRERFADAHRHVSKDAWPNARSRERRQRTAIAEHLRAQRSVVVDNTNPTLVERAPLIEMGRAHGATVVSYGFVVSVGEALRRNAERVGRARISDVGIFAVAKRLAAPAMEEGFDAMFEVRLTEAGFVVCQRASCHAGG